MASPAPTPIPTAAVLLIGNELLSGKIRDQNGHALAKMMRHLRRMREVYAGRLALLAEEVRGRLAGALELGGMEAGLQTAGWLAAGLDADAIAARAAQRDVEVTTIGRYRMRAAAAGARDGLLLGFAAVDAAELRRGVRELARAVEG